MRSLSKVHRRAKSMRSNLSLPEGLLWSRLRYLRRQDGPSFRRQHPAGPYILDFYCSAARLCILVRHKKLRREKQAAGSGERFIFRQSC